VEASCYIPLQFSMNIYLTDQQLADLEHVIRRSADSACKLLSWMNKHGGISLDSMRDLMALLTYLYKFSDEVKDQQLTNEGIEMLIFIIANKAPPTPSQPHED